MLGGGAPVEDSPRPDERVVVPPVELSELQQAHYLTAQKAAAGVAGAVLVQRSGSGSVTTGGTQLEIERRRSPDGATNLKSSGHCRTARHLSVTSFSTL